MDINNYGDAKISKSSYFKSFVKVHESYTSAKLSNLTSRVKLTSFKIQIYVDIPTVLSLFKIQMPESI